MRVNLFFCINMQRAGNTLLGSILNQNPDITFTPNSPLTEIIYKLDLIKKEFVTSLNFPHDSAFNNLITKSFYNYSEIYKTKYVINRANWQTEANLDLLKEYFDKKIKFLILYRNPLECLASLCRAYKYEKEETEKTTEYHMNIETGSLGNVVHQIPFVRKNYEHLFVTYDEIINNPQEVINNIYSFFKIPKFKHTFKNLKQFEIQGVEYDDSIFGDVDLHTIRTDEIKKKTYKIEDYLLPSVIEKYKHLGEMCES